MKKRNLLILLALIFTYHNIFSQENNESKFNIIGSGGIGYGIIENDSEPNYNLNSNSGEILLNYRFTEKFGIASGIGLNQLTGNGFNSLGEFYHERNLLKIPLLLTLNGEISENIEFFGNFGFFAQNIVKDNYGFLSNSTENIYKGWNFGGQVGVGILFNFTEKMKIGFIFNSQSDLSKFESNSLTISSKQKLRNLSTVGLLLKYEL
jgi:opacity protein-like surface antigen